MGNEFMKADANLTRDLEKARTPEEISEILHAAVERSSLGVTRDPQTGQFVRRDPLTPAAQTSEPEARVYSKTVKIGGKDFTFTDESEDGLNNQIASAQTIAEELQDSQAAHGGTRFKSSVERAEEILNEQARKTELEAMLRSGLITTQQFLESSGSIDQYLATKGVDVAKIAGEQYEKSWATATEEFLHSEAGKDWPGGPRNLEAIGLRIAAMGLTDSPSVESLAKAWTAMKESGAVFNDTSDERILAETANMSPSEILERFKEANGGDAEQANAEFISAHRGGRIGGSTGIFGR